MVMQNVIVGKDRLGKELRCGDICSFQIRRYNENKTKQELKNLKGIIVYDEESYGFMFETLDDNIPMLLMHVVEYGSIEYEVSIKGDGFIYREGNGAVRDATYCSDEESAKWHSIYREHLE